MDSLLESVWLRRRRHLDTDCRAVKKKRKVINESAWRQDGLGDIVILRAANENSQPQTGSRVATFFLLSYTHFVYILYYLSLCSPQYTSECFTSM
jgi:hypothetical protein